MVSNVRTEKERREYGKWRDKQTRQKGEGDLSVGHSVSRVLAYLLDVQILPQKVSLVSCDDGKF